VDVRTAFIAGTAIAAPTLLRGAARAGAPIPVYTTLGQRAALGVLAAPVLGVAAARPGDCQALDRVLEIRAALLASHGAAAPNFPKLSPDELVTLCDAMLDAMRAGVRAEDEPYVVASNVSSAADGGAQLAVFDKLAAGESPTVSLDELGLTPALGGFAGGLPAGTADLTELGAAVADVAALKHSLSIFSPARYQGFDTVAAQKRVGALAVEMDAQGYLITGRPVSSYSVLELAGAWWNDAAERGAAWALGHVPNLAADLLLSTPGALLVVGYLGYRAVAR
jgi:hypothetical protein